MAKCEKIDCTGISSTQGKNVEDRLALIVRDDGKGFPEGLDFRNTDSLGFQLVTALVDQINGSIGLDASRGTGFIILFQELKYKPWV